LHTQKGKHPPDYKRGRTAIFAAIYRFGKKSLNLPLLGYKPASQGVGAIQKIGQYVKI
jgi:hypothetical protein